jgi:hypothetical protein
MALCIENRENPHTLIPLQIGGMRSSKSQMQENDANDLVQTLNLTHLQYNQVHDRRADQRVDLQTPIDNNRVEAPRKLQYNSIKGRLNQTLNPHLLAV